MTDTRTSLLLAAAQVVRRSGGLNLTLEAVAQQAGVSKGGLLYHFPNKEALVAGLIGHELESGERAMTEARANDTLPQGRFARAFAAFTLNNDPTQDVNAGLFAAIALNPELLEPVRERYRDWQARAESDGLEPGLGTLLRLAMDGLWLADLLDLASPTGPERRQLEELVARLTTQTQTAQAQTVQEPV